MKLKKNNNTNFNEILSTIQSTKQKAINQVNSTLIELYWDIGKYISTKAVKENWGKGVVKELANFIKIQDPTIKGFTDKNLWMMKNFYETYKDDTKLYTLCREISWSNNRRILSLKTKEEREFYIITSIKEKYSYRELEKQIEKSLFERTMIANDKVSSALVKLPQDTRNVFKDSYILDFLDITPIHKEKDLQKALICSLNRSLSPTVVSEYKTKLIPKKILQDKMNELYERFENDRND